MIPPRADASVSLKANKQAFQAYVTARAVRIVTVLAVAEVARFVVVPAGAVTGWKAIHRIFNMA